MKIEVFELKKFKKHAKVSKVFIQSISHSAVYKTHASMRELRHSRNATAIKEAILLFFFIVGTSCILNNVNNGELDAISEFISHTMFPFLSDNGTHHEKNDGSLRKRNGAKSLSCSFVCQQAFTDSRHSSVLWP